MDLKRILRDFIPAEQGRALQEICSRSEGRQEMAEALERLVRTIQQMPKTYETREVGDPIVHLHYFVGSCDWWITERDVDDDGEGQIQAFGYANLGDPQNAELGYISIKELCELRTMNVDLYWHPVPLSAVRAKIERRAA